MSAVCLEAGMSVRSCQTSDLCDCFRPRVAEPNWHAAPDSATPTRAETPADRQETSE